MATASEVQPDGAQIRAAARTLKTLELLAVKGGVTVLELADALQMDKSVASRLLATLVHEGWVVREEPSDRHDLSMRLLSLANYYGDRIGFPEVCQPILEELAEDVHELVQLSMVTNDALVLVAHAEARHRLAIAPARGTNVSLHATASGKVFLASLEPGAAIALATKHGITAITARTITDVDELTQELRRVRRDGYATTESEFIEGVDAVAVQIGNERFGRMIGTLAVSAPATRLNPERVAEIVPVVRDAAAGLETIWPAAAVRLAPLT